MQITKVETEKLIPYARNARTHTSEQVSQICASIKEFGFTNPVLIDEDNVIIAGHGRVMASQRMNLDTVPCVVLKHLTDAQKKAYVIADNQLALNAGWNEELLRVEIEELDGLNFNLELLGFDDIDKYLNPEQGLTDEDEVPEISKDIISQPNDLWLLGNHKLICGDSTDINVIDRLMNNQKADMIFTDPPYGINYSGGRTQVVEKKTYGKIQNDDLTGEDLGGLIKLAFTHTKKDADVYICVSPLHQKPFLDQLELLEKPIDAIIVWDKKNAGLGYMKYRRQCEFILFVRGAEFKKGDKSDFDLWSIARDNGKEYQHGNQKPVQLIDRALKNSSKRDDLILDLFGGSGSTLLSCEKNSRVNYSIELEPKFCDVILKRWQNYTGKHAVHADSGKKFDEMINRDINT